MGQGQGGQGQGFPKGSAEEAVINFCTAISEDNLSAANDYISSKAKGLLVQIRDGKIADEKLESMKSSMAPDTLRLVSSRVNTGGGKYVSFGNTNDEILSFTVFKEGDAYKMREFKIGPAPRNAF